LGRIETFYSAVLEILTALYEYGKFPPTPLWTFPHELSGDKLNPFQFSLNDPFKGFNDRGIELFP
jgi:hypothetical protein